MARFCARAFDLPVVITRLNTFMGTPVSFPGMHIAAVLEGRPMFAPCDPNPHSPIHLEDMKEQLEPLLGSAGVPALVTNWCGDEVVTAQDWVRWAGELSGREGSIEVRPIPCSPPGAAADPTRRRSITGPCRVRFEDAFRRLYETMAGTAEDEGGRA